MRHGVETNRCLGEPETDIVVEDPSYFSQRGEANQLKLTDSIKARLICPISCDVMQDPVTLIGTGTTYDRAFLCESLLAHPNLDPATGQRFHHPLSYTPNLLARGMITDVCGDAAYQAYDDRNFKQKYEAAWQSWMHSKRGTMAPIHLRPVTMEGAPSGVFCCCAVFARNTRAIAGSADKTLKVWDLESRQSLYTLKGHAGYVLCCAVYGNGTRAISGSVDTTLKIWDLENRRVIFTLRGHSGYVHCCSVFANGTRAITGSADTKLKVWNLKSQTGYLVKTLKGHTRSVTCCVVFARGSRAISGSLDGTLKVWNLETEQLLYTLQDERDISIEGLSRKITCCAVFDSDTRATRVIVGSADGTLKVWDLSLRKLRSTLRGGHTQGVKCVAVFANGTRAISGSEDKQLRIWDLQRCHPRVSIRGHTGYVTCCALISNGTRLISGSSDKTLRVWDISSSDIQG